MFTTHHKQRALSFCLLWRLGQPALIQPDKEPFTVRAARQKEGTQTETMGVRSDGKTTSSEPLLNTSEEQQSGGMVGTGDVASNVKLAA